MIPWRRAKFGARGAGATCSVPAVFFRQEASGEIVKSGELGTSLSAVLFRLTPPKRKLVQTRRISDPPLPPRWGPVAGAGAGRAPSTPTAGAWPVTTTPPSAISGLCGGTVNDRLGRASARHVQFAFDEAMPMDFRQGGKFYVSDNTETPDTMQVTYRYPGFIGAYEKPHRECVPHVQLRHGTAFHGTKPR